MVRRFVLLAAYLSIVGCSGGGSDAVDLLRYGKIECQAPAKAEYGPWSESGGFQACKIIDGPFVAWEDGYVHVRGQYDMGKETGVWRWYDRSGAVVKEEDYTAAPAQNRGK